MNPCISMHVAKQNRVEWNRVRRHGEQLLRTVSSNVISCASRCGMPGLQVQCLYSRYAACAAYTVPVQQMRCLCIRCGVCASSAVPVQQMQCLCSGYSACAAAVPVQQSQSLCSRNRQRLRSRYLQCQCSRCSASAADTVPVQQMQPLHSGYGARAADAVFVPQNQCLCSTKRLRSSAGAAFSSAKRLRRSAEAAFLSAKRIRSSAGAAFSSARRLRGRPERHFQAPGGSEAGPSGIFERQVAPVR